MKLYATPKSHFSRKVRLVLDNMGSDYALVDVGNVADNLPDTFSGNPVMSVPVLEDGSQWMIESDHIAAYLVRTYAPEDPFAVLTESVATLNARAIMNSIMVNEVKLILAARMGLDPSPHAYFQKAKQAILRGMDWLEERPHLLEPDRPTYADFHLISLWDHLELYGLIEMAYPRLREIATRLTDHEIIRRSRPPE